MRSQLSTGHGNSYSNDKLFVGNNDEFLTLLNKYYAVKSAHNLDGDRDNNTRYDLILRTTRSHGISRVARRIKELFLDYQYIWEFLPLENRNARFDLTLHLFADYLCSLGVHKASLWDDRMNKTEAGAYAFYIGLETASILGIPFAIAGGLEYGYQKYKLKDCRTVDYKKHKSEIIANFHRIFTQVDNLTNQEVLSELARVSNEHMGVNPLLFAHGLEDLDVLETDNQEEEQKESKFDHSEIKRYLRSYASYLDVKDIDLNISKIPFERLLGDISQSERNLRLELVIKKFVHLVAGSQKKISKKDFPAKFVELLEEYQGKTSGEIEAELNNLRAGECFVPRYEDRDNSLNRICNSVRTISQRYSILKRRLSDSDVDTVEHAISLNSRLANRIRRQLPDYDTMKGENQFYERWLLLANDIAQFLAEDIGSREYSSDRDRSKTGTMVIPRTKSGVIKHVPNYDSNSLEGESSTKQVITEKLCDLVAAMKDLSYEQVQERITSLRNEEFRLKDGKEAEKISSFQDDVRNTVQNQGDLVL